MKQSIFYSTVVGAILFLLPLNGIAQQQMSKQFKKSYASNEIDHLFVDNRYGDIYLEGWDKDSVVIEINVISQGKSQDAAQELLDRIQPSITSRGTKLLVSSEIAKKETGLFSKLLEKMGSTKTTKADSQIDYLIYLPKTLRANLLNKYGDIVISNWNGILEVAVEHGDIRLPEEIEESVLSIKFGKLKANSLIKSKVLTNDANIDIKNAVNLKIEAKGTEISLDRVNYLELISNKDELQIGSVQHIEGNLKYSTLEIDNLENEVNLWLSLAELRVLNFTKRDPKIRIDQKNSEVYFNISNTSFQFEATLEQGVLRLPKSLENIESKMLDNKKKIRKIRATYGTERQALFSFSGMKGIIIFKEL